MKASASARNALHERSVPLLAQWCTRRASVAPVRQQGSELEFRRRQSLEPVHAVLVAEQLMAHD